MTPSSRPVRTRSAIIIGAVLIALTALLVDAPAAAAPSHDAPVSDAPVWRWPLEGERVIVRAFEAPKDPWGQGHRGIDASAVSGQAVRAPADGSVFFSGTVVNRPVITLEHSADVLSSFEAVTPLVETGDRVMSGQVIGTVTVGPHCASDCLHIGVRVHGEYVNPLIFFGGIDRAVLLPLAARSMPAGERVDSFL